MAEPERLFLPGWGATASMYRPCVAPGWVVRELPSFRATGGVLRRYADWLVAELEALDEPAELAGHSMGGAIAVLAAAARPQRVARLVLISPSVLPVSKSMPAVLRDTTTQILRGRFRLTDLVVAGSRLARSPRLADRLSDELRGHNMSADLERVHAARVKAAVVACTTDTLVTPAHSQRAARLLGATYRELALNGGHNWMFAHPLRLIDILQAPA